MIGIVVVSHSAMLAAGLKALADQLGSPARLLLAAGVDDPDHPIGTDAIAVMSAIEEADDGSGVLVLMDLGSALLSAETALELLPPELSARVRLCPAPLVEGTLAAVVRVAAHRESVKNSQKRWGRLASPPIVLSLISLNEVAPCNP